MDQWVTSRDPLFNSENRSTGYQTQTSPVADHHRYQITLLGDRDTSMRTVWNGKGKPCINIDEIVVLPSFVFKGNV